MYSVMLMAALSAAPSSQTWHRGGHHGYSGSYCNCSCSCGYGGYGYGGGAYGYYGCYGCYGYPGYGGGWYSGTSVFHGYLGTPFQCHGCYGCYGGWSCYGMPPQPVFMDPLGPNVPPQPAQPPQPGEKKTKSGNFEETPNPKGNKPGEQARAKVTIDVPADAKVYIDGNLMKSISGRRTFQTPDLVPGNTYYYEFKAEVVRDGRLITANQRVILRPGEQVSASFADLGKTTEATAQAGQR